MKIFLETPMKKREIRSLYFEAADWTKSNSTRNSMRLASFDI